MPPRLDDLVSRIRGEYREMPGLRLTRPQACRLWQIDAATCELVLRTLTGEGFLYQTAEGRFVALPMTAKPLHVDLPAPGRRIA